MIDGASVVTQHWVRSYEQGDWDNGQDASLQSRLCISACLRHPMTVRLMTQEITFDSFFMSQNKVHEGRNAEFCSFVQVETRNGFQPYMQGLSAKDLSAREKPKIRFFDASVLILTGSTTCDTLVF
mmetsp:Transcript_47362/g.99113  ORF Transcript_47362/g.99113 Transcript_47362/m.99113 type:complete len:126 (-) Transcript_47362:396-773(-)